jgi:hypothetical protein
MAPSSMAFLYVGPAVSALTHASGSALFAATESNTATNSVRLKAGAEIHSALVHPLFEKTYACVEHGADRSLPLDRTSRLLVRVASISAPSIQSRGTRTSPVRRAMYGSLYRRSSLSTF